MLKRGRNSNNRQQSRQPHVTRRATLRATDAVVMTRGMVMACVLAFIQPRMLLVGGSLLATGLGMVRLTGHVLRGGRIMARRQALGQRRNARPQRQAQHQQKTDKGTGNHCC